jgi:chromatin remodeling complex protein RSC6
MVRAVKSTTAEKAQIAVVEKVKVPKKAKVAKETPVESATVAPVVAPVDGEVVETKVSARLGEYADKINQLSALVSSMKAEFKALDKSIAKELKAAEKASQKRKRASGNRAPSGFVKPTLISDELALFLGKDKGILLARTAVSKEINNYIRANKLQDPTNGRKIIFDSKLGKLLKLTKTDELTYFNLQKFMKHHFIKETPVAVV